MVQSLYGRESRESYFVLQDTEKLIGVDDTLLSLLFVEF